MTESCASCRYFFHADHGAVCRRNPPGGQIIVLPGRDGGPTMVTYACWPPVRADEWCGEYRRVMMAADGNARLIGKAEGRA